MTDENWKEHLKYRWARITAADIGRWRLLGKDVKDVFAFEFFVYVEKPDAVVMTVHRAGPVRMLEAEKTVRAYESANDVTFGPITRYHVTKHHARMPDGTQFSVPADNTTRQVQMLDAQGETAIAEEEARAAERTSKVHSLRMKVNGTWVAHEIDVAGLRQCLGLPEFLLGGQRFFHGYSHPNITGPNIADVDHAEDSEGDEEGEIEEVETSKPAAKQYPQEKKH